MQLECEVDVLREDLKQKTEYYQTSIDAATEILVKETGNGELKPARIQCRVDEKDGDDGEDGTCVIRCLVTLVCLLAGHLSLPLSLSLLGI